VNERWIEADGARLFLGTWGEDDARPVVFWNGVGLNSRGCHDVLVDGGPAVVHAVGAWLEGVGAHRTKRERSFG
jgi:hypothetical protein